MNRQEMISRILDRTEPWDMLVVGGGATGVGIAVDAASRRKRLHPDLPVLAGEVLWATRFEAARTVDDFLARRTRCLCLNAHAAIQAAPKVASLMAGELEKNRKWESEQVETFQQMGKRYLPCS